MPESTQRPGTLNHEDLAAYLDYHLLGAAAGVKLFDSVRESWAGTPHESVLRQLRDEVAADRKELKALLKSFGYRRNKLKQAASVAGAAVSKINPLNPMRSSDGVGAELELESLQSALRGKQCLWRTLRAISPADARLNAERFQQLEDRAVDQQRRVERVMAETAGQRFLAGG